jgi:hypothetical protein
MDSSSGYSDVTCVKPTLFLCILGVLFVAVQGSLDVCTRGSGTIVFSVVGLCAVVGVGVRVSRGCIVCGVYFA